ncbi:hypothetical protein DL93DRAFT_2079744 [Clavulina sp. PMI_390]|nr:hypothetical protein DL93DRAFT_2079744 [Clavulina sp. PMI_390]
MVNFISIFSIASLVLSGIVSATSDGSNVRRHHVSAIQRRAAHDHQAAVLADRNLPSSPSDGAAAVRRKARRAAGRCKARNTTSTDITSTSTDSPSTTTSLKMVKTTTTSVGAPGNPGGDPTTTSTPTTTKHTTSTHTTSKAAKTTSVSSGGGGGSGTTYSGDGTYYGTGLGACGITSKDTDYIVAVSHLLYDSYPGATANPNDNPICGKKIEAHYGGNSVTVTVVDRCVGCAMRDLDFSPSAFSQLADQSLGRISITWQWAS